MVYVLNSNGQPLMPSTRYGKVRRLLKEEKAKVITRCPFTIQLMYESTTHTQEINLGIDAGSKTIGISATTKEKVLYESEITLRSDIVNNLSTRRECRRARRNRKTRYRKPRFNNRKKEKGWLSPSIQNKINAHLKAVSDIHKILPITKIIAEVAAFDIQKIKNPDIKGKEHQEGEQLDSWNVREYVLFRDHHTCQHCHGKSGDKVLEVHHLESRKTGGNAPNNLLTLCKTCHEAYHKGEIKLKQKRGASFKDATFMGVMRWAFYNQLKETYDNVSLTYGYITKHTRITNSLPKAHRIDARCISGNPTATPPDEWFRQKRVRTRNRQLHKMTIEKGGVRKSNQAPKEVFGFQLFDKVLYGKEEGFIFGRRSSGCFDIRKLDGTKISAGISCKKLKKLETRKSTLTQKEKALPLGYK